MNNYGAGPQNGYGPQGAYGGGYQGGGAPAYGGGYAGADEVLEAYLPSDDQSGGLAPIPEGVYPSRVTDVQPKTSPNTGGYYWAITCEVADGGPYNGRKLFFNANWMDGQGQISKGVGFAQLALKAMGLNPIGNGGPANFRKSDVVGKMVAAVVSIQQEGQYRGRNQTDRLEPLESMQNQGYVPPAQGQQPNVGYAPPPMQQPNNPGQPMQPAGYPGGQPGPDFSQQAPPQGAWGGQPGAAPQEGFQQPPQGFQQPAQPQQWGGAGGGGAPAGGPRPMGSPDF